MAEYKLSASLKGHEDDVRAVAFPSQHTVISASRDSTVRVWTRTATSPPTYDDSIAVHGSAFVNAVAYVSPSHDYAGGLIVSGGKDTIIDVRQPGQPPDSDPERLLLGHQGNVCALDVCRDGQNPYLVSGSWDASAMVWDISKGESTVTLEGHEASVWAVLAYDGTKIITGCADKQIRVFRTDGKMVQRIRGGSDVVRALCKLPPAALPAQFASAGNDGIIRLWTLDGTEVAQLHGHENFIYSLAALPTGEIISSSEDRTVRIWRNQQCIQTITHPAISVWTVAVCPENGDIVTGASDRIVRVFTRSADRVADADTLRAFDDAVRSSSIPQQQMGEINKEKLPGPEFLQTKSGTKEGQVQLIRESNGNVSAHQWSAAAQQWVSVGTVVDAAGSSGRKQEYMGQDYDYVFDVDIAEGKPPLKLPFNLSQNPYEVAHKFIGDNELPMDYIDQVAKFIVQNTQGATIGQNSSAGAADPWGQESRYRPGEAGGPTSGSASPAPSTRPRVLPQKEYLTIATAAFPMIRKKIEELNTQLISAGRKDLSFNPSDLQALASCIKTLETTLAPSVASKPVPTDSESLSAGLDCAVKIFTQWPAANRIPGLDLYRLLAATTPASASRHDPLSVLSTSGALPSVYYNSEAPAPSSANASMLAIRALANLFNHQPGRAYILGHFSAAYGSVWTLVQQFASNRNVLIAAMTLFINLAVALGTDSPTTPHLGDSVAVDEMKRPLKSDLVSLLADPGVVDSEVQYRALVALGTLLSGGGPSPEEKAQIKAVLGTVAKGAKEPRIKSVIEECAGLL